MSKPYIFPKLYGRLHLRIYSSCNMSFSNRSCHESFCRLNFEIWTLILCWISFNKEYSEYVMVLTMFNCGQHMLAVYSMYPHSNDWCVLIRSSIFRADILLLPLFIRPWLKQSDDNQTCPKVKRLSKNTSQLSCIDDLMTMRW